MADDSYSRDADKLESPARRMWPITPGANAITPLLKALRVDIGGVLVLRAVDSDADVTLNVFAGETICVRAKYVKSGTTATVHGLA